MIRFDFGVSVVLRAGEEVHCARILGEWSNMIGFELGSSLIGVYTIGQDFFDGELQV